MIISLSLPPALDHEPSPKTGTLPASNVYVKASILISCEQLYKWLIITLNSKSSLSADNEPQNSESTWWNFFLKISRHMVFIRMSLNFCFVFLNSCSITCTIHTVNHQRCTSILVEIWRLSEITIFLTKYQLGQNGVPCFNRSAGRKRRPLNSLSSAVKRQVLTIVVGWSLL